MYALSFAFNTALTLASDKGHSEVVQVLLEAGANVNHADKVFLLNVLQCTAQQMCIM